MLHVRLQLESLEDRRLLSVVPATQVTPAVLAATALHLLDYQDPVNHPIIFGSTAQANLLILAQARTWLHVQKPAQQLVLRNDNDLLAATGMSATQLAQLLNVPSIDWASKMVVMVSQGYGSYGAASPHVDITNLKVAHNTLTVEWHLDQPNPNQAFPMWMVLADPAEFVLVKRFDGPVKFQQDATVILPPPP